MIYSVENLKMNKVPRFSGVYLFRGKKNKIIYIGKATNLRNRVSSYFQKRDANSRINANQRIANNINKNNKSNTFKFIPAYNLNSRIRSMVKLAQKIEIRETDSVLEALILEANLIKKHKPKYNIKEKDDKTFSYFVVTKEEFPKVLIKRESDLHKISNFKTQISNQVQNKKFKVKDFDIRYNKIYGPYTSKKNMQTVLRIIRKIFPFHARAQKTEKGCLDFQIGLCPGPYVQAITKKDYQKNIRNIKMILEGKKKRLISTLEKEMKQYAKDQDFEKAAESRNKIFALKHIRDVALINKDSLKEAKPPRGGLASRTKIRIEAYDISNISGDYAVGSMVVFKNNEPDSSQYRKFKIRTISGIDDVSMMKEVLERRFNHPEWKFPDLIMLDGGQGHLNMAERVLRKYKLNISLAAVAKGPTRKNLDLRYANLLINANLRIANIIKDNKLVKKIMDEAHRFAIGYHRKLRNKNAIK